MTRRSRRSSWLTFSASRSTRQQPTSPRSRWPITSPWTTTRTTTSTHTTTPSWSARRNSTPPSPASPAAASPSSPTPPASNPARSTVAAAVGAPISATPTGISWRSSPRPPECGYRFSDTHTRPASPEIAASQYVQERHKREEAEDSPHQLPAACHVGTAGQVDPHEDNCDRMEEADQQLDELLHDPNLPGLASRTAGGERLRVGQIGRSHQY